MMENAKIPLLPASQEHDEKVKFYTIMIVFNNANAQIHWPKYTTYNIISESCIVKKMLTNTKQNLPDGCWKVIQYKTLFHDQCLITCH
jgi:hypothetical protein